MWVGHGRCVVLVAFRLFCGFRSAVMWQVSALSSPPACSVMSPLTWTDYMTFLDYMT